MPRVLKDHLLLRFHATDTDAGVTRATLQRVARLLDIDEVAVVHLALADLAKKILPTYEPDDGPLTERQQDAMRKAASPVPLTSVKSSLFHS